MGWYLRKSKSLGPLRLNFSKGGIGVSFGVKGARVGISPRGQYIHLGRHGLYFRQQVRGQAASHGSDVTSRTAGDLGRIESADVSAMADEASAALLEAITRARSRIPALPIVLVFGGATLLYVFFRGLPLLIEIVAAVLFIALLVLARAVDQRSKAVELEYELSGKEKGSYEALVAAGGEMARLGRVRLIEAAAATEDWKRHAGAGNLLKARTIVPLVGMLKGIRSSLHAPIIPCGSQELCFLPDRILVAQGTRVGAIAYPDLTVRLTETQFVENEAVPADGRTVGSTWRYVNKSGGPDRRFANNRELPVALYGEISLTSPSGLNERLQLSSIPAAERLVAALKAMALVHQGGASPPSANEPALSVDSRVAGGPVSSPDVASEPPQSEVERIMRDRPRGWEYLLFAAALAESLKKSQVQVGEPKLAGPPTDSRCNLQTSLGSIEQQLGVASSSTTNICAAVNDELPQALGPAGVPGDPEKILRVANNMAKEYGLLRTAWIRLASEPVPPVLHGVAAEAARSLEGLCRQVEKFAADLSAGVAQSLASGTPLQVSLTLTMEHEAALSAALQGASSHLHA